MITISILKNIPLFEGIEDSDLEKISQVVKEQVFAKNSVLFKEGDIGEMFYIVKEGSVEVLKNEGGELKIVNTISHTDKNNFFGEMALIEGAPRSKTIRTLSDAKLLVIAKRDFDMILRLNSFISLKIMSALSKRLRTQGVVEPSEQKLGKIIVIFSPKSGTGKSTFAVNLGAGLAKVAKDKVLLVDLDLQFGDLGFMLGATPKNTIADLVEHPSDKIEVLREYLVELKNGFSLLSSPGKPEQSEMIHSTNLKAILQELCKHFEYIILDTHSLFQDITINAMDLADLVFLLTTPNMNHLKSMLLCLKVMENLKYSPEKIKLVLNREGSLNSRPKEDIETGLKRKMDFTLKEDYIHVCELIDNRKTVFDLGEETPYARSLKLIIENLTGKSLGTETEKSLLGKLKGWFGT
ncbi:cyclic nucleotide-binding domain-containing protein [bacterium]|nr:cyclic nucleotide-binding domain-containing protein [bacterium]